jgi:hypothetical protein
LINVIDTGNTLKGVSQREAKASILNLVGQENDPQILFIAIMRDRIPCSCRGEG